MTFSADIIAGFPTENEEMFKIQFQLLNSVKLIGSTFFLTHHALGTPASKMPQIPKDEIEKELNT